MKSESSHTELQNESGNTTAQIEHRSEEEKKKV